MCMKPTVNCFSCFAARSEKCTDSTLFFLQQESASDSMQAFS